MNTKRMLTDCDAAPLLALFNSIYPLSKNAEVYLRSHLTPMTLAKGNKLHKSGNICEHIYFITKGAVRGYIKEDKKDNTTWISIENEMVAAIYSFTKQVPSIENMQAMEDCELLRLTYKDMHQMYELYPETNILARRFYEKYYADAEVRALIARLSHAKKKYAFFLQAYSHLSNRIPLTYIASFLGMSLETLSRVRSEKKVNQTSRKHIDILLD